jgi:hypothetical protein
LWQIYAGIVFHKKQDDVLYRGVFGQIFHLPTPKNDMPGS